MPQKRNIIATKTISGEVHIFDYYKHKTTPETDEVKPQLKLAGHTKEGYGLSWNPREEGLLLSGADDANILVWDIRDESMLGSQMVRPKQEFKEHDGVVEDVCWHKIEKDIFGSVGDDKKIRLWDMRQQKSVYVVDGHTEEILCLDFSPFNPNLLLTGSVDKTIALWDRRNLKQSYHLFKQHNDEVNVVKFHPHHENLLASGSSD